MRSSGRCALYRSRTGDGFIRGDRITACFTVVRTIPAASPDSRNRRRYRFGQCRPGRARRQAVLYRSGSGPCPDAAPQSRYSQCHNTLVLRGTAERILRAVCLQRIDAVYADPARRDDNRRYASLEQYAPPLSVFDQFAPSVPILVKIGPAATAPAGWQVATVASGRECKEILLHRNLDLPPICALHADSGDRWTAPEVEAAAVHVLRPAWLMEAHAAIIRTGRLAAYFREHRCEAIDPHIAYAWSETRPEDSRWHQSFRILRIEPYNRKDLQRGIDALDFGAGSEIKKRGFPENADSIRARLRFRGRRNGVIILTRQKQNHLMIFAERP
jgi:hypothetical protein